jgi:hypothetical protein
VFDANRLIAGCTSETCHLPLSQAGPDILGRTGNTHREHHEEHHDDGPNCQHYGAQYDSNDREAAPRLVLPDDGNAQTEPNFWRASDEKGRTASMSIPILGTPSNQNQLNRKPMIPVTSDAMDIDEAGGTVTIIIGG